jgi:hypothetical protein
MTKMKSVKFAVAMAVVVAIAAFVVAQDKPWFDMEKCAMCSNLASQPGLLEHMGWDHYKISNGLMSVTTCPEEYKETYAKAMAAMKAVQEKMEAGEKVYLDGFCTAYGELMMAGAKREMIETPTGNIVLLTSNDPKVIKKIHDFGQRTMDELAKMAASMMEEDGE